MSELEIPESWASANFGRIVQDSLLGMVRSVSEQGPKRKYHYLKMGDFVAGSTPEPQRLALVDATAEEVSRYQVVEGDFIFNTRNSPELVGKVTVIPSFPIETPPVVFNNNLMRVRFSKGIYSLFVGYLFRSRDTRNKLRQLVSGTTSVAAIYARDLNELEIPLPPLGEQRRIVAKIDSTFKRIEAIEKAVESAESLLTKYRESLLNKAFRGELVPQDSKDEPASKLLEHIRAERAKQQEGKKKKKDDLPPITEDEIPFEIPKSWEWVRLGAVVVSGPNNGLYLPQSKYGGGYPILRIDDFQNDWCRPSIDLKKVKASANEIAQFELAPGDIVVNRVNSMSHLGKSTVIDNKTVPAIFESNMMKFRVASGIVPRYAQLWLQSGVGRSLLIQNAKRAIGQASINQTDVSYTLLPLPPSREQVRILETLAGKSDTTSSFQKNLLFLSETSRNARAALLVSAFSGRLVPQAPSEGTGHQLLEQILATKTETDTAKTKSKDAAAKSKPRKPKK
jgi:type I restriction enzyme S subunit